MTQRQNNIQQFHPTTTEPKQLRNMVNYAAELELEVDRLRRLDQHLHEEARDHIRQIVELCRQAEKSENGGKEHRDIMDVCEEFGKLLRDLHEPPEFHPSFDQVILIAFRPLAEQVFRWQQRLSGATNAVLRMDLEPDSISWFPARLLHILDNVISNALRYRDPAKGEIRLGLQLRIVDDHYELRFTDNGIGIPDEKLSGMLELSCRASPTHDAKLGVGLAAVKLLVEQSCGTLSVSSGEGRGTSVVVELPIYEIDDHID